MKRNKRLLLIATLLALGVLSSAEFGLWSRAIATEPQQPDRRLPTLFIIDQRGLVRFVHSGFRPGDEQQISAAIDSLF